MGLAALVLGAGTTWLATRPADGDVMTPVSTGAPATTERAATEPATPPVAAAVASNPDLTGYWKLDPASSVFPPRPERGSDGARRGGGGGRGEWRRGGGGGPRGGDGPRGGGPEGARGPGGGPEGGRGRRLPDLMHITQTDAMVSFEDSTGSVVQEVMIEGAPEETAHGPNAAVLKGAWLEGHLLIERPAWRRPESSGAARAGATVNERVTLEDRGATLVIVTAMPSREDMPAREIKRVYRKVTEWE